MKLSYLLAFSLICIRPACAAETDYLVAEDSKSPDGNFAIAYPKAGEDDPSKAKNFVVALKPFKVLAELDGDGLSAGAKRRHLDAEWTADSSKLLATMTHDKWGMIVGCSVVVLNGDQPPKVTNLLKAINQVLEPDFRKSKGETYNNVLPFALLEPSLEFSDEGKSVSVKTEACNDPNLARSIRWSAQFEGIWNIEKQRWDASDMSSKIGKNE